MLTELLVEAANVGLRVSGWRCRRSTPPIDEYVFPLEDARAEAAYGMRSAVNKVLIINREYMPGRITVVFVDEALGF